MENKLVNYTDLKIGESYLLNNKLITFVEGINTHNFSLYFRLPNGRPYFLFPHFVDMNIKKGKFLKATKVAKLLFCK